MKSWIRLSAGSTHVLARSSRRVMCSTARYTLCGSMRFGANEPSRISGRWPTSCRLNAASTSMTRRTSSLPKRPLPRASQLRPELDSFGRDTWLKLEDDPALLELKDPATGILAWPVIRQDTLRLLIGDHV